MKAYRLRVTPHRAPEVYRILEVAPRHTLHDVHLAIQDAFELGDDHLYSFFLSGTRWDSATQYSSPGGRGRSAHGTPLFELGLMPGREILYLFDYGDELCHTVRVESFDEVDAQPAVPRVVESVGDAPEQYPDAEDSSRPAPSAKAAELLVLANELLPWVLASDVAEHPPRAEVEAAYDVALRLAEAMSEDLTLYNELDMSLSFDILGSLLDLPFQLARNELVDEAVKLGRAWAFLDPPNFLPDCALILAHAGRQEEALAQVEENLARMPDDSWVEIKSGGVLIELGEHARGEAVLRGAAERAPDRYAWTGAFDLLKRLLESQGRRQDLDELAEEGRRRFKSPAFAREGEGVDSGGYGLSFSGKTFTRETPKVGRNDPCPCGSGKKHKKCCG